MIMPNRKILSSVKEKPYFKSGDFVLYHADSLKILERQYGSKESVISLSMA